MTLDLPERGLPRPLNRDICPQKGPKNISGLKSSDPPSILGPKSTEGGFKLVHHFLLSLASEDVRALEEGNVQILVEEEITPFPR